MNSQKLLIWISLSIVPVFSKDIFSQCQRFRTGHCSRGQYVVYDKDFSHKCVDCPAGTFMDFDSHVCESCKKHSEPENREADLNPGSSSSDSILKCQPGFFRSMSQGVTVYCERCSTCEGGLWAARDCSSEQDTLCCSLEMVAGHSEDGRLTCIFSEFKRSWKVQSGRQERSSGHDGHNSTHDGDHVHESVGTDVAERDQESKPDHGYSKAETTDNRTEFPVWARILCAGVAIGVFLFYLGVGIPCNACGSRDKLRALRKWAFHRHEPVPTEEGLNEKPKPKPTNEEV